MIRKLTLCLWIFLTLGCCAADDPTKGGLFCYNPRAYERRLEERRQGFVKQENTRQALTQESRTLQNEAKAQRGLRDQERESVQALKYELAQLEDDVVRMQKEMEGYKAKTAEQRQKKQRVIREVNAVKRQLIALSNSPQLPVAEKKEYKAKLRREIEALLEIINSLTVVGQ